MSLVYKLTLVYIHQSMAGGQLCYISHTDHYEHLSLLMRVYTYHDQDINFILRYEHDAPAT